MLAFCLGICFPLITLAAHPKSTPVSPTLEIEVLDPGVDPNGNPAVTLDDSDESPGDLQVEIPPTVLVLKYYYTGNRTFQGPMLPGGPSILVINHPKTGERCYLSVQMLPGAPRVNYCERSVEFDYGENAIIVVFPFFGSPTIKYRNGTTWSHKVAHVLHLEQGKQHLVHCGQKIHCGVVRTKEVSAGLLATAKDATKVVTVPAQNIVRVLPLGNALSSGGISDRLVAKGKQAKHDHEIAKAERLAQTNEATRATNR